MNRKSFGAIIYVIAGIYILYTVGRGLIGYFKGETQASPFFVVLSIVVLLGACVILFLGVKKFIYLSRHPEDGEENVEEATEENEEAIEEVEADNSKEVVSVLGKAVFVPKEQSISDRLKALSVDEEKDEDSAEGNVEDDTSEEAPEDGEGTADEAEVSGNESEAEVKEEEPVPEMSAEAKALEERLTRGIK